MKSYRKSKSCRKQSKKCKRSSRKKHRRSNTRRTRRIIRLFGAPMPMRRVGGF